MSRRELETESILGPEAQVGLVCLRKSKEARAEQTGAESEEIGSIQGREPGAEREGNRRGRGYDVVFHSEVPCEGLG